MLRNPISAGPISLGPISLGPISLGPISPGPISAGQSDSVISETKSSETPQREEVKASPFQVVSYQDPATISGPGGAGSKLEDESTVALAEPIRENKGIESSSTLSSEELLDVEVPTASTDDFTGVQVSLNQLIASSMYTHPFIRAEIEKVAMARGDFWTASLKPNPELSSSFTLIPLDQPFTVDRQGGPPQFDIGIEYPVDWYLFGKRTAAMAVAHLGVHISQAELENVIRQRVLEASAAYFDALEAHQLRLIAERNVDNLRRLQSATKSAIDNGGRPVIEGKRIALDLLSAEQDLRTASATERSLLAKVRAFLGSEVVVDQIKIGDWPSEIGTLKIVPNLEQSISLAVQSRPDLESLRWQQSQASADINLQQRLGKPNVAPSIGYTRQYQQKAIGFPDADSFGAGLALSLPLHDRNQGNIAKAFRQRNMMNYQIEAAILELEAEIRSALAELEAAIANLESIENEQIELANEVLESIQIAYENGGRPLIDVLDAQRNFREINSRAVTAKAKYWKALYRYYASIGRQNALQP